jgi:hypothetical protein
VLPARDDEYWLETAPFPYYSPDDFSAGNGPRWSFPDTFGDGAESEEIAAMLIEHGREMSSDIGSATSWMHLRRDNPKSERSVV